MQQGFYKSMNVCLPIYLLASNEQATIMRDPALDIFKAFGDMSVVCYTSNLTFLCHESVNSLYMLKTHIIWIFKDFFKSGIR